MKSRSPIDHPMLTPLVSFISLCEFVEPGLILSLGILTLSDIDHVRIIKSGVFPPFKRGGITCQSYPKHASVHRNLTPPDLYIRSIGSKTRRYKETHKQHAG